jgi:hypothetical protein
LCSPPLVDDVCVEPLHVCVLVFPEPAPSPVRGRPAMRARASGSVDETQYSVPPAADDGGGGGGGGGKGEAPRASSRRRTGPAGL